jgi:hypothetical protein
MSMLTDNIIDLFKNEIEIVTGGSNGMELDNDGIGLNIEIGHIDPIGGFPKKNKMDFIGVPVNTAIPQKEEVADQS